MSCTRRLARPAAIAIALVGAAGASRASRACASALPKKSDTSRRRFCQAAGALAATTLAFAASGVAAQSASLQDIGANIVGISPSTTVIYTAREFRTMDPARPTASAVAVQDGRFVAVGNLADLQRSLPAASIDHRFDGKTVTPGLIEQHVHPALAAVTMATKVIAIEDWDYVDGYSPAVRDAKEYRARLATAIKDFNASGAGMNTPLITWGYHHYFHGPMDRAELDRLAGERPIIVWHRSAHEFFFNTAALRLIKLDAALLKTWPASAQEQIDLEKGHFYEQGLLAAMPKVAPYLASPEQFRRGLEFTRSSYHKAGITLACEPGMNFTVKAVQDFINSVYSPDETPFNHCFIGYAPEFVARAKGDAAALIRETRSIENWGKGRTFVLPAQIKLMNDGAIFSQLMQMKDGYTDGHKGVWMMDDADFRFAFDTYWDAGYQIHIHNNGDAGMDRLLDSLEAAIKRRPRQDHRTVIVHFGFAADAQVDRAARLGAIISTNPYYVTALAGRYAKLGIGPERAADMVPLDRVMANNMSFSLHSDMPMSAAKPLLLVWAAVNRMTAEGQMVGTRHKVPVDLAMRGVTTEAAYSIRQENRIGSIMPGKDANLTILEQSPWAVAPEQIKDIKIWGTMLEGRVQPVAAAPVAQTAPSSGPNDPRLAEATLRHAIHVSHSHDGVE